MRPIRSRSALAAAAAAAALILLPLGGAAAQDPVVKPTGVGPVGGRLPRPQRVLGRQLDDGRIEVRWTPVAGAVHYDITRSVAGAGQSTIAPGPTDTVYVDADVKAGNTYYYVVQGVDGAGQGGLKAGSNAVRATSSSTGAAQSLRAATPADEPPAEEVPSSAWNVITSVKVAPMAWSDPRDAMAALSWEFTQGGVSFMVERAVTSPAKGAWQTLTPTGVLPCCTYLTAVLVNGLAEGATVLFRITAVDPANPARKSVPVTSKEYTVSYARLPAPARMTAVQLADGTIRVSWAPVSGAVQYVLRTNTNLSSRTAILKSETDTTYVDPDAIAGSTSVYVVTPQSANLVYGLGASASIRPTFAAASAFVVNTMATTSTRAMVGSPMTPHLGQSLSGVHWISLDEGIATVDATGLVTGRSAGTARILATGTDANGLVIIVPFRVAVSATAAPTSPPD